MYAGMFAKQNAQSSNPKVRMLAAEKRFTSAEVALQRAERDLERAVENAKRVKLEPNARVRPPTRRPHDIAPHGWTRLLLCPLVTSFMLYAWNVCTQACNFTCLRAGTNKHTAYLYLLLERCGLECIVYQP